MKLPEKKLTFKILENEYIINFPNNGQYIDIESMKARLTKDTYNTLSEGGTVSSQLAKYTTDLIAFITVCCPQLKKDLKVDTLSELDMYSTKKLLKVYVDQILPWLMEWESILNSLEEEDEDKKSE